MRRRPLLRAIAALPVAALLMLAGDAAAQSVGASMSVLLVPTTGAGVRPLDFGVVAPGGTMQRTITTDADSSAAGIAHFNFTGLNGNRDVQLTFDFPVALTHTGSGDSMPITFDGNYGLHCFDRQSGIPACALFNPSPGGATPSVILIDPPPPPRNGTLRLYLGGSVTAGTDLVAGTYQGMITLTMVRL